FIELFSNKGLKALHLHFLPRPQQFAWLLGADASGPHGDAQDPRRGVPRAEHRQQLQATAECGPAFAQMTCQLTDEVAANTARLTEFRLIPRCHRARISENPP